jgi:hypothetical protein
MRKKNIIKIKINKENKIMVAPHFHRTEEAKAAIKRVEKNTEGTSGPPTGIAGGSGGNNTTMTPGVDNSTKGGDWVGGSMGGEMSMGKEMMRGKVRNKMGDM